MSIQANRSVSRKRYHFTALLLGFILLPLNSGWSQGSVVGGIDMSGHFDFQAVANNVSVANNDFQLGQFALNLKSDLGNRIAATMEFAYAADKKNVAVNEAFVDWNLFRWDGSYRDDPIEVTRTGFVVGQFDVPFGIDWRVYRSIDRKLVTVPAVIANTHRGWNDMGIQFYGQTTWANWSVFALNGLGTSPALHLPAQTGSGTLLAAGDNDANGNLIPTEAYGGRFGLMLNDHVECGTSFGAGYAKDNIQQSRLVGFDATVNYEPLQLTGEFISHRRDQASGRQHTLGYYLQGTYSLGRPFVAMRLDAFRPDQKSTVFHGSAGAGYVVNKFAQLRAEYQMAGGRSNDTVYLQSVVAF